MGTAAVIALDNKRGQGLVINRAISAVWLINMLGHESQGSIGARVYTHPQIKQLAQAIETLETLNLPVIGFTFLTLLARSAKSC